jgi:serine/threonine protein kinase
LAEALEYLHSHGLVHRDIKPSNIVYVKGEPCLADIGLVTNIRDASTLGYIPPEGPGKPAADIYNLGKVLYEAATGLDSQQFPELPEAARQPKEARALSGLNEVLLAACVALPRNRYPHAGAMAADLDRLAQGKSISRIRRPFRLAWAALVVATISILAYNWFPPSPGVSPKVSPAKNAKKPPPPAWLTNGLVAHWPLDGNAEDASGHGHHGSLRSAQWEFVL